MRNSATAKGEEVDDLPVPHPTNAAIDAMIAESGRTNKELAETIGVSEAAVGRWRRANRPTDDQLFALEQACERQPGYVLRAAGFIVDTNTADLLDLIRNTPQLTDTVKAFVLPMMSQAIKSSASERKEQERWRRRRRSS